MNRSTAGGVAFVVVGVIFIAMGSSGQRAFLPIGGAFALIGIVFIVRQRRSGAIK
jgi:drug/metabolite transporter (DMT)-like permease